MKTFAFPYKIIDSGDIIPGAVFDIPTFCLHQKSNPKCKQFYGKINPEDSLCTCPYGFAAEKICYGGHEIILTCLNVEKYSNRKDVQKRIKDSEFIPRIPFAKYEEIKYESIAAMNESSYTTEDLKNAKRSAILENEKEALENAIHEMHNLTNQLTSRADKMSEAISERHKDFEHIDTLSKNIYALSNLMAIRLDSYKLEVDPSKLNIGSLIPIAIYKKVEKAYKCLYESTSRKNLRINLNGKSYNKYYAGSLLEIAFFIILENAVKYSPKGSNINVDIYENEDKLKISFTNWAIRPDKSESTKRYTERGYRGIRVMQQNSTEGRGIGMYLLNQICNAFRISFSYGFDLKDHQCFNHDGYTYSPFYVNLEFSGMEIGTPSL